MVGNCECGNEPSGSIKCEKFLDWWVFQQEIDVERYAGPNC